MAPPLLVPTPPTPKGRGGATFLIMMCVYALVGTWFVMLDVLVVNSAMVDVTDLFHLLLPGILMNLAITTILVLNTWFPRS